MTDVTLPDGSIATFPEAMGDADIASAVQSHLGQMAGGWRMPALIASNIAKGALTGAGAIGDLEDLGSNVVDKYLYRPLRKMVTGSDQTAADRTGYVPPPNPLNSASLMGAGRAVGAVDNPALVPQNAGERYAAAAAQGVGGMAPIMALGGGGAATLARGAIEGAGAGLGGQAGSELFPNHPLLAQGAGAIFGALTGGKAFNAGNRIAGLAGGATSPTVQAYRNLGITPTLAGDVTGSPTLQMIQAFAAKAPGGANTVHEASGRALGQWGDALENTAANLDPGIGTPSAATLEGAGGVLQLEGRNWLNNWRSASRRAWGNVDIQIPPSTPTPLTNYAQTLSDVRNAMPNAPATANTLQPALSRNLLNSLIADTRQGPLGWKDVTGIRTRIGEMLGDPQLVGDTGYADLKRIYGALTSDLQQTAAARGPQAQAAFNVAQGVTRDGHAFVENVLSKFIRGDQITPADAAAKALNSGYNGGATLQAIRDQMPDAADALAAYKLRDMGLATPGQQNATASRLSPGSFVTDSARLAPEARQALFGANPSTAQNVSDLLTTAGAMKATERFLNTSNTGTHAAVGHALGSALGFGPALAGHDIAGWPGFIAGYLGGALAPWLGAYGSARLTTSPTLTSAFASPGAAALPPLVPLGIAAYPQLRNAAGN